MSEEYFEEENYEVRKQIGSLLDRLKLKELEEIVSEDELVAAVISIWRDRPDTRTISPAELAYRTVSANLHQCCSQSTDPSYELAYGWLKDFVMRQLHPKLGQSYSDTEDLTSKTMLKIVEKFNTCRSPNHFLTWVKQITLNEYRQFIKKLKIKPPAPTSLAGDKLQEPEQELAAPLRYTRSLFREEILNEEFNQTLAASTAFDPEAVLLTRELLQRIVDCIKHLKQTRRSSSYQIILFGTFFKSLSTDELAAQLKLPVEEIRRRLSHALKLLQSDANCIDAIRNGGTL